MNELTTPETQPEPEFKLSPEALALTEVHLQTLDINQTAKQLGMSAEEVTHYLRKPEVKRFMDTVFLESGWRNKYKLAGLLDTIIESKVEEAEETGIYSNKDLLDVIQLVHKMRMEEIKASREDAPASQTNVQINNGMQNSGLATLIERLVTKND